MRTLAAALLLALVPCSAATAQCPQWQPLGTSLNGAVRALTSFDPTNSGHPLLIAGGEFNGAGSHDYIAAWNGTAWQDLGWGTDGPVYALTTWNPGTGPQLIAAGAFRFVGSESTGPVQANGIARWDGTAWHALDQGLAGGEVLALTTWTPDGPGPQRQLLVAGGAFHGTGSHDYIAYWDGTEWHDFGWGFDEVVRALTTWDPDGLGPLPARLVAGGDFQYTGADTTGSVSVSHIALWNGAAWQSLGDGTYGPNGPVLTLLPFDINGLGSQPPQLLAGGTFGLRYWDGHAWAWLDPFQFEYPSWDRYPWEPFCHPATSQTPGMALSLASWDPDGSGPIPPQLFIAAQYTYHVNTCCDYKGGCVGGNVATVNTLARWDGSRFLELDHAQANALFVFDADGPGPANPMLVAGCGSASPTLVQTSFGSPAIVTEPVSTTVRQGNTATFVVAAAEPATFQWYRQDEVRELGGLYYSLEFVSLHDGVTPTGSTISGSSTGTMVITNVSDIAPSFPPFGPGIGDLTDYQCIVTNGCGTAASVSVHLSIFSRTCTADFNHDGDSGTDQDIQDFFACIAGNCCQTCGSADFNGDGDVATDADIESFFRVLAGGPC